MSDEPDIAVAALASGDKAAWDALVKRWRTPLIAYLYRLGGDTHEAEELASETFVRAWRARATIREGRISTWLFAIATNLLRNRRRWWSRRLRWMVGWDDDRPEPADPAAAAPGDAAVRDESARRVREAVMRLPEELRAPLVLAVYEEKPQAEIAAILGCTVKAVERRVARARERLRETLGEFAER